MKKNCGYVKLSKLRQLDRCDTAKASDANAVVLKKKGGNKLKRMKVNKINCFQNDGV